MNKKRSKGGRPRVHVYTPVNRFFWQWKKFEPGESLSFDLNHNPPRIRVLLTDKRRKDVPLRCPECEVEADGNKLFIREEESNQPTKTSLVKRLCCPSGHIDWSVNKVENYLHENGYIK